MNAKTAAVSLRRLYQAHDERNEEEGSRAAADLYEILGATPEQAYSAGLLTIQAYLLSDEAEKHQGRNEEMENFFYEKAKNLLIEARKKCGFETESPIYTVKWWKACRHRNRQEILNGLVEDHKTQFSRLPPNESQKYAEICAQKMIDAIEKAHYNESLSAEEKILVTDEMLEKYFQVYFEAISEELKPM
jgi:hypothetical protein